MRIKGTSISSFLSFLGTEFGASKTKEFIASLESNLRARVLGPILASDFYPVEELESLAGKAREHFAQGPGFFERSGSHNAFFVLTGVHQGLLAQPTPLDFLKTAERSWSQFVDSGAVSADVVGDGRVRLKIEGIQGSELLCARETGFLTRSLSLAGAQQVAVAKARCTQNGDLWCEWSVAWDAASSPQSQAYTSVIRRPGV